jgi:hypothetical protein
LLVQHEAGQEADQGDKDAGKGPDPSNKVEEPDSGQDWVNSEILNISPHSLQEQQRKARENWMRFRAQMRDTGAARSAAATGSRAGKDLGLDEDLGD